MKTKPWNGIIKNGRFYWSNFYWEIVMKKPCKILSFHPPSVISFWIILYYNEYYIYVVNTVHIKWTTHIYYYNSYRIIYYDFTFGRKTCRFLRYVIASQLNIFLCTVNEFDWRHINIDSLSPTIKITYNVNRSTEST